MAYGEYLTVVNDYKSENKVSKGLNNQLPTTLCKERVRLKHITRPQPQNSLEEILLWGLTIPTSDNYKE